MGKYHFLTFHLVILFLQLPVHVLFFFFPSRQFEIKACAALHRDVLARHFKEYIIRIVYMHGSDLLANGSGLGFMM